MVCPKPGKSLYRIYNWRRKDGFVGLWFPRLLGCGIQALHWQMKDLKETMRLELISSCWSPSSGNISTCILINRSMNILQKQGPWQHVIEMCLDPQKWIIPNWGGGEEIHSVLWIHFLYDVRSWRQMAWHAGHDSITWWGFRTCSEWLVGSHRKLREQNHFNKFLVSLLPSNFTVCVLKTQKLITTSAVIAHMTTLQMQVESEGQCTAGSAASANHPQ